MTAATQLAPDRKAELEAIFQKEYQSLLRCAIKFSRYGFAEDNLQRSMVSALEFLHTFSGKSTLKTWLMKIIRNTCFDDLRRSMVIDRYSFLEATAGTEYPDHNDKILLEQLTKCLTIRMKRAVDDRLMGHNPNRSDIMAMFHAVERIRERHGIKV